MIFVGIDWSETHHDACILDVDGRVAAKGRVPEGVDGLAKLREMVAAHAEDPSQVVVGIELDRGLLVGALVAAGCAVHAIPALRGPVPGPPPDLGGEVGSGRRPGAGRPRSNRSASASGSGRGHRARRSGEGAGSGPPASDLVQAAASSATRFGSSTRRHSRPSGPTWPRQTPWPCSLRHRRRGRGVRFPPRGSPPP